MRGRQLVIGRVFNPVFRKRGCVRQRWERNKREIGVRGKSALNRVHVSRVL